MIGLLRQVLVCTSFSAYDGGLVFMQLTMLPCLQLLGVPVVLVTVSGIMSGSLTLLGLPILGWVSDSGTRPRRRKQLTVIVSVLIYLAGVSLVGSGCVLHMLTSDGGLHNNTLTTGPTSESTSSSLSPNTDFFTNFVSTEMMNASLFPLPTASSSFSSVSTSSSSFSSSPLSSSSASPFSSYSSSSSSSASSSSASSAAASSLLGPEDGSSWQANPLGLGIPLAGILGILGYVFIDMGNDCSNSCLKGFLLSSTSQENHVSLLVVGVLMSAVGGGLAAALGLLDPEQWLAAGTELAAVPFQTLLEAAFFAVITIVCTVVTFLAAPSPTQQQRAPDGTETAGGVGTKDDFYNSTEAANTDFDDSQVVKPSHAASATASLIRSFMFNETVNLLENKPFYERSCSVTGQDDSAAVLEVAETELTRAHDFPRLQGQSQGQGQDQGQLSDIESSGSAGEEECPDNEDQKSAVEISNSYSQFSFRRRSRLESMSAPRDALEHSTALSIHPSDKYIASTCLRSYKLFAESGEHVNTPAGEKRSSLRDVGLLKGKNGYGAMDDDKKPILADENNANSTGCCKKISKTTRRLALICVSMFFMAGAWQSFNTCATDYLGKVIYGGDPEADPSSQSYAAYQIGLRTGSLGVLFLHVAYVVTNLMQRKLLHHIGPKAEYLTVCALQVVALVVLQFTDNVGAYYVTSVVVGVFRSVMYTIPFLMANDICQEEAMALCGEAEGARVGSVMAIVTTMLPVSMVTVCSLTGPLIEATGNPASPMYYSIGTTAAAGLVFAFT